MKNRVIGEEVKIVYLGRIKNDKTGRTFKNFDVFHKKGSYEATPSPDNEIDEKFLDDVDKALKK